LEHDDSLNDRTEGGTLDLNFKATRTFWNQVYQEEYRVEGGMYRGEPPREYFHPFWSSSQDYHHHHHHDNRTTNNTVSNTNQKWNSTSNHERGCGHGYDEDHNDIMEGLNIAHLIGQIGASSVGKKVAEVWMSIDAPSAFWPANPKSTRPGVNTNPQRNGYIFGKGGKSAATTISSDMMCVVHIVHSSS
jgi:hypothetical protein